MSKEDDTAVFSRTLEGMEYRRVLQDSCLENPQGQRSLVGCHPRGPNESNTTELLSTAQHHV